MKMIFLGTSAGIPTVKRGLPGIYVRVKNDHILLDCGEGVQRQLLSVKIPVTKISLILITHLHGDHFFGLYGLLQTCTLLHRDTPLLIICPPLIQNYLQCLMKYTPFHLAFPLTIISPSPGECIEREGYVVRCISVPHGDEAYAYAIEEDPYPGKFYPKKAHALGIPTGPLWRRLQNGETILLNGQIIDPTQVSGKKTPGNKITYSGDTTGEESLAKFAQGSTALVHEATYLLEKDRPRHQRHATLIKAMKNAEIAHCNWLILTHFSARYRKTTEFPDSTPSGIPILYAEDLLQVEFTKTRKISIKKLRP